MHRFALDNLISRPVRAILSILGLAVAIGGMVGLFSIAGGINELVSSTFSMIPGILVQERGAPVPIFSSLPAAWQKEIEQVDGVAVVNPEVLVRVNVLENKPVISPPRFCLGFDIPSRMKLHDTIYGDKVIEGRFLNETDVGTTNVLVSRQIAEATGRKLGDTVRANGNALTIVGIYECGTVLLDCNILIDMGTLRRLARYDEGSVSCYYVETKPGFAQKDVGKRIETLFRGRDLKRASDAPANALAATLVGIGQAIGVTTNAAPPAQPEPAPSPAPASGEPPASSPVEVRSGDDWAERFEDFTADLNFFLTLITGVGITIAVLSIVNVMLMSVTERTIEFGILRANGWSRRNVMSLVTLESAVLGIVGGILGSIGGWVAVQIINRAFPERAHLHAGLFLMLFAIVFSTALGMLGGLYPAWRAAKMSPMDAIRRG
ncbi:Macrolide export ATP-binding/permease protein MacB [Caulifigura coniformis]|uniref:Macrolide export ATP-binding/permease protein MacB n=1 Tax=Caulifigura coniformis TaxID=2527983 RepID=A0A517SM83_9PLAN|nr:FtsX-like permease family protein [Caulifigura coniformis]QDT57232.1 Macrolide export ATP-binding/permease protein MacB [Caulifigura coniformis]